MPHAFWGRRKMNEITPKQKTDANWLLRHSKGKPEGSIRSRIAKILDSLDIENEPDYEPPGAGGPSDLYLPRRRTFIETKAGGLAKDPHKPQPRENNESPKEQLERYLRAELVYELGCLPLEADPDRSWTGILTDGRTWHVWRYAHEENAPSVAVAENFCPANAEELISRLKGFLEGDLVGKPWIPSDPISIFEPFLEELREIHARLHGEPEKHTQTKRRLWLDMLRTSSMAPENEAARQRLFTAHTFLVSLARGVIHALEEERPATNGGKERDVSKTLGDGFCAWIVETTEGEQWGERLLQKISSYEWRRRPGDVLRPLYEKFVGARDRKIFGEFYTPDWLADLMVREICDDDWCEQAVSAAMTAHRTKSDVHGIGVLDPTCGSGTFLYFAVRRLLRAIEPHNIANPERAAIVCMLVNGMDIHPVAAEISRATLMRALPAEPPQGKGSLHIHEGDALMLRADDEHSLFQPSEGEILIRTPQGGEIRLPNTLVDRRTFADDLRRLIESAVKESRFPEDLVAGLHEDNARAVRDCHKQLKKVVEKEGNSVWTWYIRNITGPYRLAERKVDRIVANPPWVRMAEIQVEGRKRLLEGFAKNPDMALWPGGEQAPHFDIAQLFVKRARFLYLESPDKNPAAWLVKKSALRAGHWRNFREWHKDICTQTLDLEELKPFGSGDARRACVLFEHQASTLEKSKALHIVASFTGNRPQATDRLEDIRSRLVFRMAPSRLPQSPSDYLSPKGEPLFRQGATITPKVLVVVSKSAPAKGGTHKDVTTARSQQKPWNKVDPQSGQIPARWVRPLLVSKAILPFALNAEAKLEAIIPTNKRGELLKSSPDPGVQSRFWKRLDRIYRERRGKGENTPSTLVDQMDYASKLSAQLSFSGNLRTMVIYPKSGDIMRACRICPGAAFLDFTLYRLEVSSEAEAAYLVALLNAPCLNTAFVQSRRSLRDFHLHPWRRVPIRRYDESNAVHVALTQQTARAEEIAQAWLSGPTRPATRWKQVGLSSRLRQLLAEQGVLGKIDELVREILPDQAAVLAN